MGSKLKDCTSNYKSFFINQDIYTVIIQQLFRRGAVILRNKYQIPHET